MSLFYLLVASLFSIKNAFADEYRLELPSFTQSGDPASLVNNFYLYILGIAGTLAVIMIVFGGIKYVVTAGNVSAQGDAKDIIKSAVWGLVLLAGAFLILNTINPNLVELRNPALTQQELPEGAAPPNSSEISCEWENKNENAIQLATSLRASGVDLSGTDQCFAGATPQSNLRDMENGELPFVCARGCTTDENLCTSGGLNIVSGTEEGSYSCEGTPVYVTEGILATLLNVKNKQKQLSQEEGVVVINLEGSSFSLEKSKIPNFRITSLTGDNHAESSYHYLGRAADVVPVSTASNLTREEKKAIWQWYKDAFYNEARNQGGSNPSVFFDKGGKAFPVNDVFTSDGRVIGGFHIHMHF